MIKLTPSQEDYLESIYILSKQDDAGARVKDLVGVFNVKAPSVVEVIASLKKKKLVTQEPYKPIMLTKQGKACAEEVYDRHNKIKKFMQTILSLDNDVAEKNACEIEHNLDITVINRMIRFMDVYSDTLSSELKIKINKEVSKDDECS